MPERLVNRLPRNELRLSGTRPCRWPQMRRAIAITVGFGRRPCARGQFGEAGAHPMLGRRRRTALGCSTRSIADPTVYATAARSLLQDLEPIHLPGSSWWAARAVSNTTPARSARMTRTGCTGTSKVSAYQSITRSPCAVIGTLWTYCVSRTGWTSGRTDRPGRAHRSFRIGEDQRIVDAYGRSHRGCREPSGTGPISDWTSGPATIGVPAPE